MGVKRMRIDVELSKRENEVVEALVYCGRVKSMADFLCVSEDTIRVHLKNIYSKIDIHSSSELVTWYFVKHHSVVLQPIEKRHKVWAIILMVLVLSELLTTMNTLRPIRSGRRGRRDGEIELICEPNENLLCVQ